MNNVILIGNVTKDIELKQTNSGVNVTKFSIAVNRTYKNENDEYETDFFNIVCWRELAERCSKYLKKGHKVAVQGNIQNRSYETEEGERRIVTEIIAREVKFLTPKSQSGENNLEPAYEEIEDSELPF